MDQLIEAKRRPARYRGRVKTQSSEKEGITLNRKQAAAQYRTASEPGSPAGQPGWGGGSDRADAAPLSCAHHSNNQRQRIQALLSQLVLGALGQRSSRYRFMDAASVIE